MWQKKIALSLQTRSKLKLSSCKDTSSSPQVSKSISSLETSWKCLLLLLKPTIPSMIHWSLILSQRQLLQIRLQREVESTQNTVLQPSSTSVYTCWNMVRGSIYPIMFFSICRCCISPSMKKISLWSLAYILTVALSKDSSFSLNFPLTITTSPDSTLSLRLNRYTMYPDLLGVTVTNCSDTSSTYWMPMTGAPQMTSSLSFFSVRTQTVFLKHSILHRGLLTSMMLIGSLNTLPLKWVFTIIFPTTSPQIWPLSSSDRSSLRVMRKWWILGSSQYSRQFSRERGQLPNRLFLWTSWHQKKEDCHSQVNWCCILISKKKDWMTSLQAVSFLVFSLSSGSAIFQRVNWQLLQKLLWSSQQARCFSSCRLSILIVSEISYQLAAQKRQNQMNIQIQICSRLSPVGSHVLHLNVDLHLGGILLVSAVNGVFLLEEPVIQQFVQPETRLITVDHLQNQSVLVVLGVKENGSHHLLEVLPHLFALAPVSIAYPELVVANTVSDLSLETVGSYLPFLTTQLLQIVAQFFLAAQMQYYSVVVLFEFFVIASENLLSQEFLQRVYGLWVDVGENNYIGVFYLCWLLFYFHLNNLSFYLFIPLDFYFLFFNCSFLIGKFRSFFGRFNLLIGFFLLPSMQAEFIGNLKVVLNLPFDCKVGGVVSRDKHFVQGLNIVHDKFLNIAEVFGIFNHDLGDLCILVEPYVVVDCLLFKHSSIVQEQGFVLSSVQMSEPEGPDLHLKVGWLRVAVVVEC